MELPEAIQNKIMLMLSHPIADMIKHTEWFYMLKLRAEGCKLSFDEFGCDGLEGDNECCLCCDALSLEEFECCWTCVLYGSLNLEDNAPYVFIICKKCGLHHKVDRLCHRCN